MSITEDTKELLTSIDLVMPPKPTTTTNENTKENTNNTNNFNILPLDDDPMLEDISAFKESTVSWAKNKLSEGSMLETKEVKDLVSIVDTIEKSIKPKEVEATTTLNILVQNLMEAKDDC